jgi:two-component system, chemotaxis family, chemotaxis protein CheY
MRPKVLIIDDDDKFLELLQDFMLDRFDVAVAEDIFDGSNLLLGEHFDLLILDIRMPVVDGIEYLKMLDTKPEFASMPILIVSGEQDLREKVPPAPQRAYLAKPFHAEELFQEMDRLLSLRRPQASEPQ